MKPKPTCKLSYFYSGTAGTVPQKNHPACLQPAELLPPKDQWRILQTSRIVTLLHPDNRPALALSIIKLMKRSLTRGYKTSILEAINSLSISPLCAWAEKQPHLESIFYLLEPNYSTRVVNCDLFYTSSWPSDGLRGGVKK